MRFFDEDNRQFEKALATTALLALSYVGSFLLIRSLTASDDDCRRRWIHFPTGVIRMVYRPLIVWDKFLNDDVFYEGDIDEIRFARKQGCGE